VNTAQVAYLQSGGVLRSAEPGSNRPSSSDDGAWSMELDYIMLELNCKGFAVEPGYSGTDCDKSEDTHERPAGRENIPTAFVRFPDMDADENCGLFVSALRSVA
jgi:hypothetical protein